MSLYFIISSALIVVYLIVQTISDIKTKKVYTNLNYALILIVGLMYVIKSVSFNQVPQVPYLVGGFLFLVLHSVCLQGIMGTGDAKALVVFYYQSSLMYDNVATFDLFYPVFIYFIATLLFTGYVIFLGIKKKKKVKEFFTSKERHAFFPFLLSGYVINLLFRFMIM